MYTSTLREVTRKNEKGNCICEMRLPSRKSCRKKRSDYLSFFANQVNETFSTGGHTYTIEQLNLIVLRCTPYLNTTVWHDTASRYYLGLILLAKYVVVIPNGDTLLYFKPSNTFLLPTKELELAPGISILGRSDRVYQPGEYLSFGSPLGTAWGVPSRIAMIPEEYRFSITIH